MFSPGEFSYPQTSSSKPRPFYQDRLIGALILLICMIICLVLTLGLDAAIFVPYNATHAPTLTAQAKITGTPTSRTPGARQFATITPRPGSPQQEVRAASGD